MTTADDLLKKEAQEQARLDMLVESWEQPALERIDQLLHDPADREPEIFELLGVDADVTIDDYAAIPVEDRETVWTTGLAAMIAAVKLQVFAEQKDGFVDTLERRFKRLYAETMDSDELQAAALKGISKAEIKRAREETDWQADS